MIISVRFSLVFSLGYRWVMPTVPDVPFDVDPRRLQILRGFLGQAESQDFAPKEGPSG
jgi:hypothetical protein